MPAAAKVKHRKFAVLEVLYDDGQYSIAWGIWEGKSKVLAERWNGQGRDPGYPRLANHPTWMIVSDKLMVQRVIALLHQPRADVAAVLRVLDDLHKAGSLSP